MGAVYEYLFSVIWHWWWLVTAVLTAVLTVVLFVADWVLEWAWSGRGRGIETGLPEPSLWKCGDGFFGGRFLR